MGGLLGYTHIPILTSQKMVISIGCHYFPSSVLGPCRSPHQARQGRGGPRLTSFGVDENRRKTIGNDRKTHRESVGNYGKIMDNYGKMLI